MLGPNRSTEYTHFPAKGNGRNKVLLLLAPFGMNALVLSVSSIELLILSTLLCYLS